MSGRCDCLLYHFFNLTIKIIIIIFFWKHLQIFTWSIKIVTEKKNEKKTKSREHSHPYYNKYRNIVTWLMGITVYNTVSLTVNVNIYRLYKYFQGS